MSIQTLAIIICSLFGLALFIAVFILTFIAGKLSVKNNPTKALVLLDTGNNARSFKADIVIDGNRGTLYRWGKRLAVLPKSYREIYYKGRRLIFLNRANQVIATPFDRDIELDSTERSELLYELVSSDIGAEGIRAIQSAKATPKILIIIVIAFIVGAVAVLGYNYFSENFKATSPKPPVTQQQAPVENNQKVIEVK